MKCFLTILLALALVHTTALAQTNDVRRVRFEAGKTNAVVRGTIKSDETIAYLISAKAGQKMDLDISRGAAFRLYTPSGQALQGGKGVSGATEELDETGDYRVEVEHRSRRRSIPFTLKIMIK